MEKLLEAIIDLVANSPPDKTEQLARSIRLLSGAQDTPSLTSWATNPRAKDRLAKLITAWRGAPYRPSSLPEC